MKKMFKFFPMEIGFKVQNAQALTENLINLVILTMNPSHFKNHTIQSGVQ